jgi:RND superfamily putative drug exporter
VFNRLGSLVVRRRRTVLAGTALLLVVAVVLGVGVIDRLSGAGFDDPASESVAARAELDRIFDTGFPDAAFLVSVSGAAPEVDAVDRGGVELAGIAFAEELAAIPGVDDVVSYWTADRAPELRTEDGRRAMVLVRLPGGANDPGREAVAQQLLADYDGVQRGPLTIGVGGRDPGFEQVGIHAEKDLATAEIIAIPLTLLLLLFVFRSIVAALIPALVGISTVAGALLVLFIITAFTDVSVFAINLVTTLGLGLAIDYSLLVVSRFREELDNGLAVDDAVRKTINTAGRTITFSGLTVAVSLSALLVFPIYFLRSFAYAGIGVIAFALLLSLVAVPAVLSILGHRINRGMLRRASKRRHGISIWREQADKVVDRPWRYLILGVIGLTLLAVPFLGVKWGESDHRALPADDPVRLTTETLTSEFETAEFNAFPVLARGSVDAGGVTAHAITLSQLDHVSRVDAGTGSFIDGAAIVPADDATRERFLRPDDAWFNVVIEVEPISPQAETLVHEIRGMDTPFDQILVGGGTASLIDTKAAVFDNLALAAALLFGATYVLLFMMFGSLLVPLKAIALNLLSLGATFGMMVVVFQSGAGESVLNFTSTGLTDISTPILIFGIAFGLSMDYEVFLLSRIKEEFDLSGHNEDSIVEGIDNTGAIITAAALILSITFMATITSGLTFIKLFGLGLTVAVLVDAFIVRVTIVPALMSVAGSWNWWAPKPLRRFHDRWGLTEGDTDEVIDLTDSVIDLREPTGDAAVVPESERTLT